MKNLQHIIYIASVARSGSSWLGQILAAHPQVCYRFQPLFSYELKGRVDEDSSMEEFNQLFLDMVSIKDGFLLQLDKYKSGEYPPNYESNRETTLVFKENRYQSVLAPMLRRVPNLQAIGLVRHPCAVLNSWRHNSSEFPEDANFESEWRHGLCKNLGPQDYFGYFKWKEVANMYMDLSEQFPDRFYLQHYEKLVDEPVKCSQSIFSFCGLNYDVEVEEFVKASVSSHNESYYAVYKNPSVAVKWRDEMPPYIVEEIKTDLRGTRLEQFLYEPSDGN